MNVHPEARPSDLTLDVGAPFTLPSGPGVWQVMRGEIEVHLTWASGRRHLCTLSAGQAVFGLTQDAADLRLVALEDSTLAEASGHDHVPTWADDWVEALGAALPGGAETRANTVTLGAMAVADGDLLACAGSVRWLLSAGDAVLDVRDSPSALPAAAPVAVRAGLWARVRQAGSVDVVAAEALHAQNRLIGSVADLTASLAQLFERSANHADNRTLARLGASAHADSEAAPLGAAAALETVAKALGGRIETPGRDSSDLTQIPSLARAAGLRARKVVLEPEWTRSATTPLIVRHSQTGRIQALVWQRGRYRDGDGNAAALGEFDRMGYAMSGALPASVKGLWSMARHVLRGNARDGLASALAAGGAALLGILVPLATGWLLSDIVPAGTVGLLISVGIALVMAALVTAALATARSLATMRIDGRASITLATGLIDRLLRLPAGFFKDFSAGDLNQRLENVEQIRQLAVSIVMTAGLTVVLSVVYLVVLFMYDLRLALIALALVSVYILAVIIARVLQMAAIREAAELDGKIAGLVYETLEAVPKLRSAAAEGKAMDRWRDLYAQERSAAVRAGRVETHFGAFASTYQTITMLTLFGSAAVLIGQDLPAGVFIAFLSAFGAFQGAFVSFSEQLLRVYAAQPLIERATPILEAEGEAATGRSDPGRLLGEIEGNSLTFAYGAGLAPVLRAFPFIHEAYPAALKKFQHSSGVKRSQISPMASMS